jgi:hypothetical protein
VSADAGWVAEAVADFGRTMGLQNWALDAEGRAALQLQSGLVLTVMVSGEHVVTRVDSPLGFEAATVLPRAMAMAHAKQGHPMQLGLRGFGADQVLQVARRVHWRQVSGAVLARQFEFLLDGLERLRKQHGVAAAPAMLMGQRP